MTEQMLLDRIEQELARELGIGAPFDDASAFWEPEECEGGTYDALN